MKLNADSGSNRSRVLLLPIARASDNKQYCAISERPRDAPKGYVFLKRLSPQCDFPT